jgi:hypothetical protein
MGKSSQMENFHLHTQEEQIRTSLLHDTYLHASQSQTYII